MLPVGSGGRIGWPALPVSAGLALVALGLGILAAEVPLGWAVGGLSLAILLILTLIEPLVGLGATLIFGPLKPLTDYFVPQLPLDMGQLALVATLAAWLAGRIARRRHDLPHSPLTWPLLAFIGAAMLSLPGALSVSLAVKEIVKWLQVALVMWLVVDLAGGKRWPLVIAMVLLTAIFQATIGVWQFALRGAGPEHFEIMDGRFYRAYGTFEQPNPYGGFIGLSLGLTMGLTLGALDGWWVAARAGWCEARARGHRLGAALLSPLFNINLLWAILAAGLAGFLVVALVMSWSRGAWLGFSVAFLGVLAVWPRRWWMGLLMAGATVFAWTMIIRSNVLPAVVVERLVSITEFTETFDVRGTRISAENYAVLERLAHWQAAEEMARYRPWLGVGFGNYELAYPDVALLSWPDPLGHAHNYYLNVLAETGVVGLATYVALWVVIVWHTLRLTRSHLPGVRAAAIGLLGAWVHLSAHQIADKLYVANIHLHIGALLGVLSIMSKQYRGHHERSH
jgi:putative inorganic carbon (HCO3(-)) transporter